jgi:nucleoside-diphosphate-sugar epimerase
MSERISTKKSSRKWVGPQEGDLVCVTGANGFLGSHIIKQLLERGYQVRGTVRSTKDPAKTEFLRKLPGAKKRLQLVEADLSQDNAFDEAFKDCKWVIHNASPVAMKYKDAKVLILTSTFSTVMVLILAGLAICRRRLWILQ